MSFLTLEDVNGCLYSNQGFYWHEIDTSKIDADNDFTDVKYDFCKVSRETGSFSGNQYRFSVEIDNDYWTKGYFIKSGSHRTIYGTLTENTLTIDTDYSEIQLYLYLGVLKLSSLTRMVYSIKNNVISLDYKSLSEPQTIPIYIYVNEDWGNATANVMVGINEIYKDNYFCGYLFVNLVRSDFQFDCTQSLIVGKVNTVQLGTDTDYKPNGDLIGEHTPTITVEYNNQTIPVTWDSTVNDYVFNIDLTNKQNEGNIRLKVIVEANQVINTSETIISLPCSYEAINNYSKLVTLFKNGGIGRITSNISLSSDLILSNDVYLISQDKTLTMNAHKIVVPSDKTFKAQNLTFTGGVNTIQQHFNSKVELTGCTFSDCTGLGSVIDCQIDVASLDDTTDFTTIITDCTFTNNDLCILHGGDLTITDCTVNGKISDKDYPYFLYQTDGRAVILQSQFNISSNSQITSDIGFNPCIFTCGETALINGHNHTELQNNNLTSFFETQRNTSTIDLTYKYSLINDYIRLKTSKGFCHNVSGIDYVFKTNVTPERI